VKKSLASRLTDDGALQLHVEDSRSQHRNKELARERLVEVLKKALFVPKKRRVTKPSKASKKRRVDTKKARAGVKSMRKKPTSDS
jgi:ribosome-associated protein